MISGGRTTWLQVASFAAAAWAGIGAANADEPVNGSIDFQPAATAVKAEIITFHNLLLVIITGIVLLVLGMIIGRPYCRYLCPYSVLLGLASSVSKWRFQVTPSTCTQCRLCEQACPFTALNPAITAAPVRNVKTDKRRLAALVVLLPVLVATGLWLGGISGTALARKHRIINLAERVHLEESGAVTNTTDASNVFHASGTPAEELFAEARKIQHRYVTAGRWAGIWIGLVIGLKLLSLAIRKERPDYEADQTRCVACARCYRYCPEELKRLGLPVPE